MCLYMVNFTFLYFEFFFGPMLTYDIDLFFKQLEFHLLVEFVILLLNRS